MFESIRKRARSAVVLGIAAALVVAGVAAAQGSSGSDSQSAPIEAGKPGGPPPMMMGGPGKNLTYAEFHVEKKEGGEQVIRLDQGKITALGGESITVEENDGSEVTVAVDSGTQILAGKPGAESTLDDLSVGEEVSVCGPEGGTAKSVVAMPKNLKSGHGPGGPGPMPPPSGEPEAGE
jgi:hypothetical protein